MAGTKIGGLKAAKTNKERHGDRFYANIGKKGGEAGNTGGFAANRELARTAGAKGGRVSKRGPSSKTTKRVEVNATKAQEQALDEAFAKITKAGPFDGFYEREIEALEPEKPARFFSNLFRKK